MADEIELKFKIENYKKILKKLLKNAQFIRSAYEVTIMYDTKNKELFRDDARLRLRRIIDLKNNEEKAEISYKKPKSREGIKVEEEYTTNINNFKEAEMILKKIGFYRISSYERIRDLFLKDGIKITIDSFPFGDFLEIEGEENKIKEIAKILGFDLKNNLTKSCDDIYAEICEKTDKRVEDHIKFKEKDFLEAKNKRDILLK